MLIMFLKILSNVMACFDDPACVAQEWAIQGWLLGLFDCLASMVGFDQSG